MWHAVERPVEPIRPTTSPLVTCWPTVTSTFAMWL
jgi:hypothetical protein